MGNMVASEPLTPVLAVHDLGDLRKFTSLLCAQVSL